MNSPKALMFGTDVVSCVYADYWNTKFFPQCVVGFIAANADVDLEAFRPGTRVFRDDESLAELVSEEDVVILFPEHRREDFQSWARRATVLPASTELVPLPEPPDYVIQWIPFVGSPRSAFEVCDGFDSVVPTKHAIASQVQRMKEPVAVQTPAEQRQIRTIETIARTVGHPLRVVDFGGAAGGHFLSMKPEQRDLIESWTVVETAEMASRARESIEVDKLNFVDSLDMIEERPDFLLVSSSLQYVNDFEGYLEGLLALEAQFFCIDRTPFIAGDELRIFLQRVFRNQGDWCYETSYPMFAWPMEKYMGSLTERYRVLVHEELSDESGGDQDGVVYHYLVATRL